MARPIRCAPWRRSLDVEPIGTARTSEGVLLIEWPLPWPRDVVEVADLAEPLRLARDRGLAVQLIAGSRRDDERRVILHQRPDPAAFTSFQRHELAVHVDAVVDAARALAGGEEVVDTSTPAISDVLICTHGRRDVCCGSLGSSLFKELERDGHLDHAVTRIWRTSHLGGHRFAPNTLMLPTGTMWAFADRDLVARVDGRLGPASEVLGRFRGSVVLEPELQALEQVAFAEVGWTWLDHSRRGSQLGEGRVRLVGELPDSGVAMTWEATAVVGRRIGVPDCGTDPSAASAFESEIVLRDIRRT